MECTSNKSFLTPISILYEKGEISSENLVSQIEVDKKDKLKRHVCSEYLIFMVLYNIIILIWLFISCVKYSEKIKNQTLFTDLFIYQEIISNLCKIF